MTSKAFVLLSLSTLLALLTASVKAQIIDNHPTAEIKPTFMTPGFYKPAYPNGIKLNYIRVKEAKGRNPNFSYENFNLINDYVAAKELTQFFDGLGRPLQIVARQQTPGSVPKDVVTAYIYDAFGREEVKLPTYFNFNSDQGKLDMDPTTTLSGLGMVFPDEHVFFSKNTYEASPLNRVVKQYPAGNSWSYNQQPFDRSIKTEFLVNSAVDTVHIWDIAFIGLEYDGSESDVNIPITSLTAVYGDGELLKNVTKDEQNNVVVEYKDKSGNLILKKIQAGPIPADYRGYTNFLCTYYIYDDFGQLRFVIPPKAVDVIKNNWVISSEIMQELCFRYEYDGRDRVIAKKVPGSSWVYMIYDRKDRLVYYQDGNMRGKNHWQASLYDALNRIIMTGIIEYSGGRDQLQAIVDQNTGSDIITQQTVTTNVINELYVSDRTTAFPEYIAVNSVTFTGDFTTESSAEFDAYTALGQEGFTSQVSVVDNPIPAETEFIPLTTTKYDVYPVSSRTYSTSDNNKLDFGSNHNIEELPTNASWQIRGLVTERKVRILENPDNINQGGWLTATSFYDNNDRLIQLQSDNIKGGIDVVTSLYNFEGKVITSYVVHSNPAYGGDLIRVKTNMEFDHAGRLLKVYKSLNDSTEKTLLVSNEYDLSGQLKQKRLGTKNKGAYNEMPLEVQDFQYNARGWLKGVNMDYARSTQLYPEDFGNKWFGFELCYDWGFSKRQFNGSIAGVLWRSKGDGEERAYGFGYDQSKRIMYADFYQKLNNTWGKNQSSGSSIDFSVRMGNGIDPTSAYDANGNIKSMKQWGLSLNGTTVIDSLSYTYNFGGSSNTNKLLNIIDSHNDVQTLLGDFRSSQKYLTSLGGIKSSTSTDYSYDANGNLTKDLNKDIGETNTQGIKYNHLNLPFEVTVFSNNGVKGVIKYIYDANGNKLEKRIEDYTNISNPFKNITYINGFVYESDKLQFLGHEEGRIRVKETIANDSSINEFIYDYFLKDHLGNVRVILTEEIVTDIYPIVSLENTNAINLESQFYRIDPVNVVDRSSVFGLTENYQNNNGFSSNNATISSTDNSQKLYRLHGNGPKMGLGITLRVMAGDEVSIFGKSYWKTSSDEVPASSPSSISILELLKNFVSSGVAAKGGVSGEQLNAISEIVNGVGSLLSGQGQSYKQPKAYINWILFDENFRPIISTSNTNSGFDAVAASGFLKSHLKTTGAIKKNGYLYIYCSNESNVDVFFDNLQIVHKRGPLIEEAHYYPFGLTMAGISSAAAGKLRNKLKFNGYEQQTDEFSDGSGLEWYDYKNRFYDNQVGRFFVQDKLATDYVYYTPYQFAGNEVPNAIDLDGLEPVYTDPKQLLYQGLGQLTQGMGRAWDKLTGYFVSNKAEAETPKDPVTGSSVVATNTSTFYMGGNLEQWVIRGLNSSTNSNANILPFIYTFKFESKTKLEVKNTKEFGSMTLENKAEIDGSSVTSALTVKNIKLGSGMVDVKVEGSKDKDGTTNKVDVKSSGNASVGVSVAVKSNNGNFVYGTFGIFFQYKKETSNGTVIKNTTTFGKTF